MCRKHWKLFRRAIDFGVKLGRILITAISAMKKFTAIKSENWKTKSVRRENFVKGGSQTEAWEWFISNSSIVKSQLLWKHQFDCCLIHSNPRSVFGRHFCVYWNITPTALIVMRIFIWRTHKVSNSNINCIIVRQSNKNNNQRQKHSSLSSFRLLLPHTSSCDENVRASIVKIITWIFIYELYVLEK